MYMSLWVADCGLIVGTDLRSRNSACVQLGRDHEEEGKSRSWRIERITSLCRSPYCGGNSGGGGSRAKSILPFQKRRGKALCSFVCSGNATVCRIVNGHSMS